MANVSSSNGIEKYPKLRFPEFTEPWTETQLTNLFKKNTKKNNDGSVTNVISNSAKNGLIPQKDYFDKDIANADNTAGYYIIRKNDFVYNPRKSTDAPYGPISRYTYSDDGIVSPLYLCFRGNDNINPYYFEKYFKSSAWHRYIYMSGDRGARHDRVSIKDETFFEMPINLPCEYEQDKIATFLSVLEHKIEKQAALVDNLKKYKRGVIRTIFNDNISFGKNVKLKEVACIYDGTHQTPEYTTQGVKFVSVENIEDLLGSKKHISSMAFYKDFKVFPEAGDVLMTRIGDIGRAAYVNFSEKIAFYVSLALFKCSSKLNGEYLRHFICTDQFQKELWERTLHIAFPKKINTGEIGECHVVLPPINEQIKIATICSSIDKKIYLSEKELSLLQFMKAGLQQQLFI